DIGSVPHAANARHPVIVELVVAADLSPKGPAVVALRAAVEGFRSPVDTRFDKACMCPCVAGIGTDVATGPIQHGGGCNIWPCLYGHVGGLDRAANAQECDGTDAQSEELLHCKPQDRNSVRDAGASLSCKECSGEHQLWITTRNRNKRIKRERTKRGSLY